MPGDITQLGITLLGVCWAEFFLATVFIGTRMYSAFRVLHRVAMDLYLALFTFVRFIPVPWKITRTY